MADASVPQAKPSGSGSKGANPNTDYKARYLRCKDRFDRATTDQAEIQANILKASQKQVKLDEEINFLLDAIAIKRASRATRQAPYQRYSPPPPLPPASKERHRYSSAAQDRFEWRYHDSYPYRGDRATYRSTSPRHHHSHRGGPPPIEPPNSVSKRPRPTSMEPDESPRLARFEDSRAALHHDYDGEPALKRARND